MGPGGGMLFLPGSPVTRFSPPARRASFPPAANFPEFPAVGFSPGGDTFGSCVGGARVSPQGGGGGGQKILRVSGTRNEWGEEMSGGPGPPEIRRIKADAGREGPEIFPACAGGARPVLGDEGRLEANGNFGEKNGCGAGGGEVPRPEGKRPVPICFRGSGGGPPSRLSRRFPQISRVPGVFDPPYLRDPGLRNIAECCGQKNSRPGQPGKLIDRAGAAGLGFGAFRTGKSAPAGPSPSRAGAACSSHPTEEKRACRTSTCTTTS